MPNNLSIFRIMMIIFNWQIPYHSHIAKISNQLPISIALLKIEITHFKSIIILNQYVMIFAKFYNFFKFKKLYSTA